MNMKNKYALLVAVLVWSGILGAAERPSAECIALAARVSQEVEEILSGVVADVSPQFQVSLQIMLGVPLRFQHTMTGHDRDKFEAFSKQVAGYREELQRCKKNDSQDYCRITLGLSALRRFELYDSIRKEMEAENHEQLCAQDSQNSPSER